MLVLKLLEFKVRNKGINVHFPLPRGRVITDWQQTEMRIVADI